MRHPLTAALVGALITFAAPALAGNSLIAAGQRIAVGKSAMTVAPDHEWNKLGARPGRSSEEWTLDGDGLNDLTFYGGIEGDKTLFREVSKRNKPLPHFSSTMLLTDIPALLEQSYRIALDTPLMTVDGAEPAILAGNKAIRFHDTFTRPDEEVKRGGDAIASIVGGKLYMITFEAPTIFYFDRDVAGYRAVVSSARIG